MEVRPLITAEAETLSPHLHECVAEALGAAQRRLTGLVASKHPALLAMVLRAEVRERLEQRMLPAGWTVGGDSRLMEQLALVHAEHMFELRFLKERRRTYPGGVPTAGRNSARRRAWHQATLDLELADVDPAPPAATTFLLVWDLRNPQELDDGFTPRVVHPVEPGVYGHAVTCDLSLDLLPNGAIFDRLVFEGDADETDFFPVEIAETAADDR